TSGGHISIKCVSGHWKQGILMRNSDTDLWRDSDFDFNADVDGDGGHHARTTLKAAKTIPSPMSNFKKGETFQVASRVETRAVDHLQNESFIAAMFRDPLKGTGID